MQSGRFAGNSSRHDQGAGARPRRAASRLACLLRRFIERSFGNQQNQQKAARVTKSAGKDFLRVLSSARAD